MVFEYFNTYDQNFSLPVLRGTSPDERSVVTADDSEEVLHLVRRVERDHPQSLPLTIGPSLVPSHFTLALAPAQDVVDAAELDGGTSRRRRRRRDGSADGRRGRPRECCCRRPRKRRRGSGEGRRLEPVPVAASEGGELRLAVGGGDGQGEEEERLDHLGKRSLT